MRRAAGVAIGLLIIAALAAIDQWLFRRLFGQDHWRWYLDRGALVGAMTSLVAISWGELGRNRGLIAAHPLDYLGSCLQVAAIPVYAFGTGQRRNRSASPPRNPFDALLTLIFSLVLVLLIVAWIVAVVPLQYFVYLVAGAPARTLLASDWRPIASMNGREFRTREIGADEAVPEGWWEVGFRQRPLAITGVFSSLLFLLAKQFLA
jgi:hypothetical protein